MELLFKHMGTSSIMDLMHNLVTLIEGPELKQSLRGVRLSILILILPFQVLHLIVFVLFVLVVAEPECDTKFSEFIESEC